MKITFCALISMFLFTSIAYCEDFIPERLTLAYTQNGPGFPIANPPLNETLNPGFVIAAEFDHYRSDHFDLAESIFFSTSFHQNSFYGNTFSLGTEIIPRYHSDFGLYFDVIGGLAYMHLFSGIPLYEINDGAAQQITDLGRPNLAVNTGLAAGYDFSKKTSLPLKIFVRYDFNIIWSFSFDIYNHALLPVQTLLIGATYTFGKGAT